MKVVETKKAEYVLHCLGGAVLSQSGVILDNLAETLGQYGPRSEDERREILRWMLFDNHKLTANIATLRFLERFQKTGQTLVTEFLRGRVKAALGVLNTYLSAHTFAVSERPTIADFSMCGYLFWNDEFGVDWADYPHVGAWLARIQRLPGWVHPYKLMPGHPLPT